LQYGDDPAPFRDVVPHNVWMPINANGRNPARRGGNNCDNANRTVADYEDILARLETLPKKVEQTLVLLQDGVKKGYTPPKPMLRDVPKQIADLIPTDPMGSPLLEPFTKFPRDFPKRSESGSPIAAGKFTRAPSSGISEAARLRGFDVLPACRESIAATALPNGGGGVCV